MIPKIFHQVWLGDGAKIDDRMKKCASSWRRMHPDWEFILWADQPETHKLDPWSSVERHPPIINKALYDKIGRYVGVRPTVAARSDLLRYELIARFGGVYLDMDVECFEPIDDLLEGVRLFVSDEFGPANGNYMFGAVKNHPAMWTVVRELVHRAHVREKVIADQTAETGGHETQNPVKFCGPIYLNEQLRKHPDLVIFPYQLFNPLNAWADPEKVEQWPSTAYGNHHYYGTWYDRKKGDPPPEFLKPKEAMDG